MADINLNIGSDDLDKLKKLLTEIQKAADKLTKTIQKAGVVTDNDVTKAKRLAAEHKKIENAIKREEIAAQRLEAQQERVNQKTKEAKGIIGSLEAQARQFRSAMKSAQNEAEMKRAQAGLAEVQAKLQQAKGTTASWSKALGSFQFKFNSLGNIAANVLSKITQGLKEAIKDSLELALQAEGIEAAFKRIATPDLLKDLREATKGTVTDLKLMQRAVMAANFKLPLNQLADLFEFATKRAQDTGESVDFLVNSIVIGIGRKSPLILDNLGISAVELRNKLDNVGHSVATVADVAKAVAEIAQEEMQKAGDIVETTAIQVEQLKTEFENLRKEAGVQTFKFLERLSTIDFAGNVSAFQMLNDAIKEGEPGIKEYGRVFGDLFEEQATFRLGVAASHLWSMSFAIGEIEDKIKELPDDLGAFFGDEDDDILPWMTAEGFDAAGELYRDRNAKIHQETEKAYKEHLDRLEQLNQNRLDATITAEEEVELDKLKLWTKTLQIGARLTSSLTSLYVQQKEKELSAVGDNAEKRLAIEQEFAKKEQDLAIATAIINGAIGITNVWATWAAFPPVAIALSALEAAIVGVQIGVIKNQTFAEGEIDIAGPSHARGGIQAEIEGGESVINKKSTQKYKSLLEAINQDDQIRIAAAMNRDKKIVVKNDPYTQKMFELMSEQVQYGEDNNFYYKHKGNKLIKTPKK